MNKFKFIIPSFNNSDWVEYNISSILNQTYQNYEVLYIDDGSEDNTYEKVLNIVENDSRWNVLKRIENKGATYNYFFGEVQDYLSNDNDIIIHLDGDDWLFNDDVLLNLNNFYINTDVWMTYGKFYCYSGSEEVTEAYPQNTPYHDFVLNNKLFRTDLWKASHMRTYRTFLYKKFDTQDLFSKIDNRLFWHASDLAFQFSYLEMCPKEKVGVVDFPTYVYNQTPKNQERTREREHINNGIYENEIRNKRKYKEGLSGIKLPQINVVGDFRERNNIPKSFSYVYNLQDGEFDATLIQDMDCVKYINGDIKIHRGKIIADIHEPPHLFQHQQVYDLVYNNYHMFDLILTYDDRLLTLPNARFRNGGGEVVLNKNIHKLEYPNLADDSLHQVYKKINLISFITSNKTFTEGHRFRVSCVDRINREKLNIPVFGVGYKEIKGKIEALKDYAYSIAIENGDYKNYFTEKILDCFLTGTIPVYKGCKNIGDYFDIDGIITFNTEDELISAVSDLDMEFFNSRSQSILNNFELAKKYIYSNDILFEKYLKDII